MRKSNAKEIDIKTVATDEFVTPATMVATYYGYIELGVHKDRIVYAIARAGRDVPVPRGEIANKPQGCWLLF